MGLYLDADLIVRHSILELMREPLCGAHLLAVPNACKQSAFFSSERGVPSYSRLNIPGSTRTFNAGVMVLDLELWRQTNATHFIIKYLNEYSDQVLWWDQDGLNAILHSSWQPLPAKWNVMTNHFTRMRSWEDSVLSSETFTAVVQDPGIIHFSSPAKPWVAGYCGLFAEYWEQTFAPIAPHFTTKRNEPPPNSLCQPFHTF